MWYFTWILGLGLACVFGILNAMWFELQDADRQKAKQSKKASLKKIKAQKSG